MGQPTPDQGPGPGAGAPPSQAPASPEVMALSQIYQVLKAMAQQNPAMSAGLGKAGEGIQEAISASLVQAPQPSPEQNPPY